MSDKIRIRSEKELELQNKGLMEIKKIFNENNIIWFLDFGTLLGAVRENDFIKWDWDINISLLEENINKEEIMNLLESNDFKRKKVDERSNNLKFVYEKYGSEYEILVWYKENNKRLRKGFKRPAKFYENLSKVKLRNNYYPSPTPVEKYLEYVYGEDWNVPKRTADKEEYFNSNNLRGIKFIRVIRRKIKNVLMDLNIIE